MKILLFAINALIGVSVAQSGNYTDRYVSGRICPDGFEYAGEDTKLETKLGAYITQEISRSPIYSCYMLSKADGGINEALSKCQGQEGANVIALEDWHEADRVVRRFITEDPLNFITSGMYFSDINEWVWLGTNYTALPIYYDIAGDNQCLAVAANSNRSETVFSFVSVPCNSPANYICEVRVQTVKYYAWFYSNWMTILLAIGIILLLIGFCVTLYSYKSSTVVVAPRQHQQSQPRPYNDAPPTYNDVTGTKEETTMEKYKNKGKDILAKVTFYRSTN